MHPLRLRILPLLFRDHISCEFKCIKAMCCHISHRVAEKISPTYLGILFYYTKGPRPIPICQAARKSPFYYHNSPGTGTPDNIVMFWVRIPRMLLQGHLRHRHNYSHKEFDSEVLPGTTIGWPSGQPCI